MIKELAITSQQYGFIAGIFFFGCFIFEIPSNLLLQRIGASVPARQTLNDLEDASVDEWHGGAPSQGF